MCPDLTTVGADKAPGDRQTEAGPGLGAGPCWITRHKALERIMDEVLAEAGPGIDHLDLGCAVFLDAHNDLTVWRRIANGVVDEVADDPGELGRSTDREDPTARLEPERDVVAGRNRCQRLDRLVGQLGEVDGFALEVEATSFDRGEQRKVFELHHLEHRSITDIATSMKKTEDAVKASLYRTRKLLLSR